MTEREDRVPADQLTDTEMDSLFRTAQGAGDLLPAGLMQRIALDGEREMAVQQTRLLTQPRRSPGWASSLQDRLDGIGRAIWPVGLTASMLLGVWFGFWADGNGLTSPDVLFGSELALELAYQVPSLTGLMEGY